MSPCQVWAAAFVLKGVNGRRSHSPSQLLAPAQIVEVFSFMDNDGTARSGPLHQPTNPYDDDAQPSAHRAYRDGWQARWAGEPHTTNPYSDGPDPTVERAWMNGWQAAHLHRAQRPGPS